MVIVLSLRDEPLIHLYEYSRAPRFLILETRDKNLASKNESRLSTDLCARYLIIALLN